MNLFYAVLALLFASVLILLGATRIGVWLIERRNPPVGDFATVNATRIHHVHVPAPSEPDLPPIVFIHGASANLKDQMLPLRPLLEGRAEMLFLDRPGHGWSGRGRSNRGPGNNETPAGQAATIAALMQQQRISRAIIVAHSFGGVVATALALDHPEMVQGLVFLSPASHPWPGGDTSWYYELAAKPVVGWLFAQTVAYPAGMARIAAATECVFAPNNAPGDYLSSASIPLVLRPSAFRANAIDVECLYRFAAKTAPRYPRIAAPTVIITGDSDTVVYEEIHSVGLARDIPGAELVWVRNLGHKPDWIAPDLAVAAIEKVSGKARDLQRVARHVEARIAADAHGAGCLDEKPGEGVPAPL
jgi:pimeloyl-ACP methyl ester carboxylesterase